METHIDTVVIGGGQAGLAASYLLKEQGIEHVVLERDRIGESWRSKRWDSFTLVTPGWTLKLPGFPYRGDPDRFLLRDEVVRYLEDYAESFSAPVRFGVQVDAVRPRADGRLEIESRQGAYVADNVVVAIGAYQRARIPAAAAGLAPSVLQLHASAYRHSDALPEGAVLVVGGGQSGAQITDELREAGREVYFSVGRSRRVPRHYRGRDFFFWADHMGMFERTVDQLDDPAERFLANPMASGKDGGKSLGLHRFARDGVRLLGRVESCDGRSIRFADTLRASLEGMDAGVREVKNAIHAVIEKKSLDALPAGPADEPEFTDGYDAPKILELDLDEAGITTVVWATGFSFDFSWIEGPEYDAFGYPVTQRGVTAQPGLYFVGLHWLHTISSGLFYGVGEDAACVVGAIAERRGLQA